MTMTQQILQEFPAPSASSGGSCSFSSFRRFLLLQEIPAPSGGSCSLCSFRSFLLLLLLQEFSCSFRRFLLLLEVFGCFIDFLPSHFLLFESKDLQTFDGPRITFCFETFRSSHVMGKLLLSRTPKLTLDQPVVQNPAALRFGAAALPHKPEVQSAEATPLLSNTGKSPHATFRGRRVLTTSSEELHPPQVEAAPRPFGERKFETDA
ncbi:hypothetical protein FQA47_016089 [Oryzias melastigma]|uniref:Uncharacterized protein n=1 Tax=Oryzias melastigma TaxID=30732 RepID=A0A834FNF4_ORYME|nr:hypothetical protein FQA47_016089 [Oryzias melastigma]